MLCPYQKVSGDWGEGWVAGGGGLVALQAFLPSAILFTQNKEGWEEVVGTPGPLHPDPPLKKARICLYMMSSCTRKKTIQVVE